MRTGLFIFKSFKAAAILIAIVLLLTILVTSPTTGDATQDQTFRLLNIERRLDQLQSRMEFIERSLQNQALNAAASPTVSNQALLELQRQHLSMAEQLITMQRQMLELKKEIDRLALRERDQGKDAEKKDAEKKDTQKQELKPKSQSKKP
ncbi:MAG: hypothetical protein L0Y75_09850 [Acidobacteria bacterium]|nr:hypothetical protein [Acidobacteriota bacterium]